MRDVYRDRDAGTYIEMHAAESKGLIFDIQGHSIHDGPGTRTLVFLERLPFALQVVFKPRRHDFARAAHVQVAIMQGLPGAMRVSVSARSGAGSPDWAARRL